MTSKEHIVTSTSKRVPREVPMHSFNILSRPRPPNNRWLQMFAGALIVVEGAIAVGKTTAVISLEHELNEAGVTTVKLVETVPVKLLNKFISFADAHPDMYNPHAAPFQFEMLKRRKKIYQIALELARRGVCVILDRSLWGDYVFGMLQAEKGNIVDADLVTYERLLTEADFLEPTMTVFLNCAPERALQRCLRRERPGEDKYTLEYFTELTNKYLEVLAKVQHPLITMQWDDNAHVDPDTERLPRATVLAMLHTMHQAVCPPPLTTVLVAGSTPQGVSTHNTQDLFRSRSVTPPKEKETY